LAQRVAEGQLSTLQTKEVQIEGGSDFQTTGQFVVSRVLKGDLKKGQRLTVRMRQTGKRPAGWAGPQGLNELPKDGQKIRLYLQGSQVLEPNGWEPL
jgi:hypothetical protein